MKDSTLVGLIEQRAYRYADVFREATTPAARASLGVIMNKIYTAVVNVTATAILAEGVRPAGMLAYLGGRVLIMAAETGDLDTALGLVVTTFVDECGGDSSNQWLVESMSLKVSPKSADRRGGLG